MEQIAATSAPSPTAASRKGSVLEAKPFAADVDALALAAFEAGAAEPRTLHGQLHQVVGHLLVSALEVAHQVPNKLFVLVGDQGEGHALFSSTARSTDSVRVSVDVPGDVVVDHCFDVRNVQTTS